MPDDPAALLLLAALFVAALLYSAVGHGGGSGYLAAMAFAGVAPAAMKPAALTLNLLVAAIGTARFVRSFSWRLFWPFACASAPLAFVGGRIALPDALYRPVVGAALIFAAWRLAAGAARAAAQESAARAPAVPLALAAGASLGLLAGLTGVGGGIFLSPLLILLNWGGARAVAAVSAPFIFVNSLAGLAGYWSRGGQWPSGLLPWLIAAVLGGLLGSHLGARRLGSPALRRLLAVVLVVAGGKMMLL